MLQLYNSGELGTSFSPHSLFSCLSLSLMNLVQLFCVSHNTGPSLTSVNAHG